MKRLVLLMLVLVTTKSFSQTAADLSVSLPQVTDLSGREVNPSKLGLGQVVNFSVPILNVNQKSMFPAGSCRLEIDLGSCVLNPAFDLEGSALNNYFSWTTSRSAKGNLVIMGNLKAGLPADFMGSALFQLKTQTPGTTIITMHWVYFSDKLKPSKAQSSSNFQITALVTTRVETQIVNRQ